MSAPDEILRIQERVVRCELCPRLRGCCRQAARQKRRAFLDWDYWGLPVPSFGDPEARLLVVGLAPAAHGGNRTGRMFTGDSSGDFLFRALYEAGFANQPESYARGDGLELRDAYISAAVRCAPPGNRPTPEEFRNCRPYLAAEWRLLERLEVVLALGRLALDACLHVLAEQGRVERRAAYPFSHGARFELPDGPPALVCAYHPSRQNTQTGLLTGDMYRRLLEGVRRRLK